jgi:hypothetical protein
MTKHLTDLAAQLDGLVATVHPSAVLALVTRETPDDIATRLRTLVTDYPDGIPSELVDMERRRVTELAHMVAEGLTD